MEEASELIDRLQNNKKLPMMTSCCPAWVRYAQIFYPELLPNLSTTKSPISIEGAIVKKYFTKIKGIDPDDIFTVAITPCTAKKWEILDRQLQDTDCVITINELTEYLNNTKIDFSKIKRRNFDKVIGLGSGAGLIFGSTGGVMESALHTAHYLLTKRTLKNLNYTDVRGYNNVKEATVKLGKYTLHVAAVDEMTNVKPILDDIKKGKCKYDFIEVMNCRGGCIGGGGQPYHKISEEAYIKEQRMASLYEKDRNMKIRTAHENPYVKKIYRVYLGKPLSPLAEELLHRNYSEIKK